MGQYRVYFTLGGTTGNGGARTYDAFMHKVESGVLHLMDKDGVLIAAFREWSRVEYSNG